MVIFVDESGDSGLKFNRGSSEFFTVSLVVFEDESEAKACDDRITLLKHELSWNESDEFHFIRNSDKARRQFLEAVAPYSFFYYGNVIDKASPRFSKHEFTDKRSFYKYAVGLVFENAKDKLNDAIVVIDQSDNPHFKRQLAKYLHNKMNDGKKRLIKDVKTQRSKSNNLLQLADYVAGAINRSMQKNKKFAADYRNIISHREIGVEIWPR
jgi:c-di-GMP-related signal transduction protein